MRLSRCLLVAAAVILTTTGPGKAAPDYDLYGACSIVYDEAPNEYERWYQYWYGELAPQNLLEIVDNPGQLQQRVAEMAEICIDADSQDGTGSQCNCAHGSAWDKILDAQWDDEEARQQGASRGSTAPAQVQQDRSGNAASTQPSGNGNLAYAPPEMASGTTDQIARSIASWATGNQSYDNYQGDDILNSGDFTDPNQQVETHIGEEVSECVSIVVTGNTIADSFYNSCDFDIEVTFCLGGCAHYQGMTTVDAHKYTGFRSWEGPPSRTGDEIKYGACRHPSYPYSDNEDTFICK